MSRYIQYKESYQKYYQTHRERILELQRKWREEHPDYRKLYRKINILTHLRSWNKWKRNNPEKRKIYILIDHNPDAYPLASECVFCGRTKGLEHAHLDYEDDGHNYVTACHQCNYWMGRED